MASGRQRRDPDGEGLHPGIVTALSTRGGQGERVAVYLDGKRAFDIASCVAAKAGLSKDEWLSEERQSELLREDEPHRAREMALGMLARRDLLSVEVVSRLQERGVSETVAVETSGWLQERGFIGDRRYATTYINHRTKAGWGRQRILAELARRGLDRQLAKDVWEASAERLDGAEQVERLAELVGRRFGAQLMSDPEGATRRANGFLARRGHDWETISAVLAAVRGRTLS